MKFDRGYISPYFINTTKGVCFVLECHVFVSVLRLEWQQCLCFACRPEVWVPGCLRASEWEEDLQRTEHRTSSGNCQPASQASGHRGWRCGWRGTQHSGPQQVCFSDMLVKQQHQVHKKYVKWINMKSSPKCIPNVFLIITIFSTIIFF